MSEVTFRKVELGRILPSEDNPRRWRADDPRVIDLAESIKVRGMRSTPMTREELANLLGITFTDAPQKWAIRVECIQGEFAPGEIYCTLSDPADPEASCNDWLEFAVPWLGSRRLLLRPSSFYGEGRTVEWWTVEAFDKVHVDAATPGRAALAAVEAIVKEGEG